MKRVYLLRDIRFDEKANYYMSNLVALKCIKDNFDKKKTKHI